MTREKHYRKRGFLYNLSGSADPIHIGETDSHQDHVRNRSLSQPQCVLTAYPLTDNIKPSLSQSPDKKSLGGKVIVYHQYPPFHLLSWRLPDR